MYELVALSLPDFKMAIATPTHCIHTSNRKKEGGRGIKETYQLSQAVLRNFLGSPIQQLSLISLQNLAIGHLYMQGCPGNGSILARYNYQPQSK